MAGPWERCGAKQVKDGWKTCNRKAGHKGEHADTKHMPATYWKQNEPAHTTTTGQPLPCNDATHPPNKRIPNPDCRDGKHRICDGHGWDMDADTAVRCPCTCHVLANKYGMDDQDIHKQVQDKGTC